MLLAKILTAVSYADRHPNFTSILMCLKVSSVQHNVPTDSVRPFNMGKYGTSRGTLKLRESLLTALLELLLAGELVLEVPHVLGSESLGLGVVGLVVGDLVDLVLVQPLPPVTVRAPLLPRVPVLSTSADL